MKKILLMTCLIIFCSSCFVKKGQWTGEQCRPKNPNFKLLETPFNVTDFLVFNKLYALNGESKVAIGFYNDGRLLMLFDYNSNIQNYVTLTPDFMKLKSWENSRFIGYWRFINNNIYIEYFVCGNYGDYIRKQGEIKGDTIFFERDCGTSNPFKTIKCPEKYILSDMSFE